MDTLQYIFIVFLRQKYKDNKAYNNAYWRKNIRVSDTT